MDYTQASQMPETPIWRRIASSAETLRGKKKAEFINWHERELIKHVRPAYLDDALDEISVTRQS